MTKPVGCPARRDRVAEAALQGRDLVIDGFRPHGGQPPAPAEVDQHEMARQVDFHVGASVAHLPIVPRHRPRPLSVEHPAVPRGGGSWSRSAPAARMPRTVR
jgi:hypothetical protein